MFFKNKNLVSIATEVVDGFKNLKNDLGKFSDGFKKYLVDEGKRLTKEAQGYEEEIVKYQAEVERCTLQWLVSVVALKFLNSFYRSIYQDVRLLPLAS